MTRSEDPSGSHRPRRTERVAATLGLRYLGEASNTELGLTDVAFPWATWGRDNAIVGSYEGIDVVAFEWQGGSWTGPGIASCALTRLPVSVSPLKVGARSRLKPFARVRLGDQRFDRFVRVKTLDESLARTLMDPGMRAFLLGPDGDAAWLRGGVSFELAGGWLACETPLLEPEQIREGLLEPLRRFRAHIPETIRSHVGQNGRTRLQEVGRGVLKVMQWILYVALMGTFVAWLIDAVQGNAPFWPFL
jgi:hypothetical protein